MTTCPKSWRLLTPASYDRVPWKNGGGVTEDVLILPEGAGHEAFDLRVSLAPITEPRPFSAFPGIDRTITRLGAAPLVLDFADAPSLPLERLVPRRFDSALAPVSHLPEGATRVLNVMVRRGRLRADVRVVGAEAGAFEVPEEGLLLLHVATGSLRAGIAGEAVEVSAGETLVGTAGALRLPAAGGAEAILAAIGPW